MTKLDNLYESNVSINRLFQPLHFTVKTFAKGFFSIETSVHLAPEEVDKILDEDGPIVQGIKNLRKLYEDQGLKYLTVAASE